MPQEIIQAEKTTDRHTDIRYGSSEHRLALSDVSLTVKSWQGSWWAGGCIRRDTKRILNTLDVYACSGEIVAFIGNSGSGKTSLLNVIANRQSGKTEGSIMLDGHALTQPSFAKDCSYVIQNDRLLPGLTVRETLSYTARLAFAGILDDGEVSVKVDSCLHRMGLHYVADNKVGGLIERGISGGEKRRLSVAIQLLREPHVMLLDEPTTGLDSFTAHYLVETLANIAHSENKLVVMTIHQPRSDIFRLLDTVGILSAGNMIYYGPRGDLVPYFSKLGHPCPVHANPLDFYIDLASMDYRSTSGQAISGERVKVLRDSYRNSATFASLQKQLNNAKHEEQSNVKCMTGGYLHHGDVPCHAAGQYGTMNHNCVGNSRGAGAHEEACCWGCTTFFRTWVLIVRRMYVHIFRDRRSVLSRINNMILFALFLWIFCWRLTDNWRSIQDRLGLIYQVLGVSCAVGCMTAFINFPVLRDLYYRESGDGLYHCVHFLTAYYIHILPFQCVGAIGFSVWTYWGVGMYPDVARFFIFVSVVFIQQHLGELQTIGCMALMYEPNKARVVAQMLITLSMQYAAGIIQSAEDLIPPLKQLTYINHYKYAAEILVVNEMVGLEFECYKPEPNCTVYGDNIVEGMYPGAHDNIPMNFGVLVAMIFIYWIVVILFFIAMPRKVLH